MSLTILDPNTALIVVDLQKGIVGSSFAHPIAAVIGRTRALIDAFRGHALPVVLVNVVGRAPAEPSSHRVSRPCPKDGPI